MIPVEWAARMEREMTERRLPRGCNLPRHDALSRGLLVGGRETVARRLEELRRRGIYRRRKHPVPLGIGNLHALREQRSHCVRI